MRDPLPPTPCPVCGALPESYREHYSMSLYFHADEQGRPELPGYDSQDGLPEYVTAKCSSSGCRHEWRLKRKVRQITDLQVVEELSDHCKRCGGDTYYQTCWNCAGEGADGHDCGEDCCCCLYPEDNVQCDICEGKGGWHTCLDSTCGAEAEEA